MGKETAPFFTSHLFSPDLHQTCEQKAGGLGCHQPPAYDDGEEIMFSEDVGLK